MQRRIRLCFLWLLFISNITPSSAYDKPVKQGNSPLSPPVLSNPSACNLNLPIVDYTCSSENTFPINVDAAPGNILGKNVFLKEVRLIITHPWAADLDIYLVSPTGVRVELSTDNGSGNDDYGIVSGSCNQWVSFISASLPSACSALDIEKGEAPFTGYYLPEGSLNDFNNGTSPIGIWSLEVCDDGRDHTGKLQFVELVFQEVSCIAPNSLVLKSVDSTAALVDWEPGSSCNATIVEFGLPGFIPGTDSTGNGFIRLAGCPPWRITDLNPSTPYELYLRENCGGGNFSANSCKISFVTRCSPPPATIREDFNNQINCQAVCAETCHIAGAWYNASHDDFDWIVHQGASPTFQTGALDDYPGGGKYIYIETSGTSCQNGNQAILTSNCIEVFSNPDSCDLSFNYLMYGSHVDSLFLEASTDGGKTWNLLWKIGGNQGPDWQNKNVDLQAFHGMVTQFRFIGRGGNGNRGDIALDNIIFYGSKDFGPPTFRYFRDEDGDGFGNSNKFIATCQSSSFPGYVETDGDCEDAIAFINPDQIELPCDGLDFNCKDDEGALPPPNVTGDEVCSGAEALISAYSIYGGAMHWFTTQNGGTPIHVGYDFSITLPENFTSQPTVHKFYVEEVIEGICTSESRAEVIVIVNPRPNLSHRNGNQFCSGTQINFSSINLIDSSGVNGQISYYSAYPFEPINQFVTSIQAIESTQVFIKSITAKGCADTLSVPIVVLPSPVIAIQGPDTVCRGSSFLLKTLHLSGGKLPLSYQWSTGSDKQNISVPGSQTSGIVRTFSVSVRDSLGCYSNDTTEVSIIDNIAGVQTSVTPVTTCNGEDGTIAIMPLSGVSPFTYRWNNGNISVQNGLLQLNNLKQGNYSFTITDSSPLACPYIVPIVQVNGPAANISIKDVRNVSCINGNDGCITLEVTGNNPIILWNNGATTSQICNLTAGAYSVTITDGSCVNTLNIQVQQPLAFSSAVQIKNVSCNGNTDAYINLQTFGGSLPHSYRWNNGSQSQSLSNIRAGNYTVTVMDINGCSNIIGPIAISEPAALIDRVTEWIPVSCHGLFDGKIGISPSGGVQPYSYLWSNGANGNLLSNLAAGNYQVTVTDLNQCKIIRNYVLPQPDVLRVNKDTVSNPVCQGIHDGFISITPTGGNGGYRTQWSNGSNTEDIQNLPPGKYSVKVTDRNGCLANSDTINLIGPEYLVVEFDKINPTCVGVDNGYLRVNVKSGGEPPYKFFWSTDFSGTTLTDLPAADYSVTISDNKGCKLDTSITLVAAQPIGVKLNLLSPSCFGTSTGQITLAISGGKIPYDVRWSTGQQGTSIAGLPAANYSATITDAVGCRQVTGLIGLTQPSKLQALAEEIESLVCFGSPEGSINIRTVGGTPPYKYFWSNKANTEDINGLKEGVYALTITDATNCVATTGPYNIVSPSPLIATVEVKEYKPCEAISYDKLCVKVSGGIVPYSYKWSDAGTDSCLSNAPVGDYDVTVTDAAGCSKTVRSVKVAENFLPVSVQKVAGGVQKICSGASNGSLVALISGGVKPIQYIWSNGIKGTTNSDTLYLSNLTASDYRVTLTDNTGCVYISDWMSVEAGKILQPAAPSSQLSHVKCWSGNDGAINASVSGGYKPYSYNWRNASDDLISTKEDLTGLKAGVYKFQVIDSIGCTSSLQVIINEPKSPLAFAGPAILTHVSCFENKNGSIDIKPEGGVPPYKFKWNNGSQSEDLNSLSSGLYQLFLSDSNNCTVTSPQYKIDGPFAKLTVDKLTIKHVSCFGGNNGEAVVKAAGGSEPYKFIWSNASQSGTLTNLGKGIYSLTITDKNQCKLDTFIRILEPDKLSLFVSSSPELNNTQNGKAYARNSGGTPPYVYNWSNGAVGDTIANLKSGLYSVTVRDFNNCEATADIRIDKLVGTSQKHLDYNFTLSPNPASTHATLSMTNGQMERALVKVYNYNGVLVSQSVWPLTEKKVKLKLDKAISGIYLVVVTQESKVLYSGKLILLND
jgi:subtilisin-like proprotein convertase family protein